MKKYTLDPELISLKEFYELTCKRQMLPGRVMLQEGIEEKFRILEAAGICELKDLIKQLRSSESRAAFSSRWKLPLPYLDLLKREAGSYLAKPLSLSDFPGIPFEYSESLRSRGFKNTREFFEEAQSDEMRVELAKKTGIPSYRLLELHSLCDLSRITGVGATMARMLYETGIRSVRDFVNVDAKDISQFSEEDILYCLHYARVIAARDQSDNIT